MPRTKAFNQEEVLDKAKYLFWEKGYHATSMQDLVDTLGINRASLYDTFGNKSLLFEKAIEKYKSENLKFISEFLYQQVNVRQGLYLLFEAMLDTAVNGGKGCFITNTITELVNTNPKIAESINEYIISIEAIYFNYLQYGINQGQISPYKDIKTIASYLYNIQSGLNVTTKVQPDKTTFLKSISEALTILN